MNTVLILGAGASWPYGFPLGSELIDTVAKLCPKTFPARGRQFPLPVNYSEKLADEYHAYWLRQPTRVNGYSSWSASHELAVFRSRLTMRVPSSIDSFLMREESEAKDHYRHIGKLAIAAAISETEGRSSFDVDLRSDTDLFVRENDWYPYFWHQLSNFMGNGKDVSTLPLRVVTFNYDRSLEQYLACRVASTYAPRSTLLNEGNQKSWFLPGIDLVDELPIVHVYGSLGRLKNDCYAQSIEAVNLRQRAERIKVIGEERSEVNFDKAKEWIADANRLVFIGFGFDHQNMTLLGLGNGLPTTTNVRKVFATTYGLEPFERAQVIARYFSAIDDHGIAIADAHQDISIKKYLRATGALSFN